MTKLQARLYQYIAEERFSSLQEDKEYIAVRKMRDEAEKRLSSGLTEEQLRLLNQYIDEANCLAALHIRHVFLETLVIVRDLLSFPL